MDIAAVSNAAQALTAVSPVQSPTQLAENRELIKSVKAVNASELFGQNNELTFAKDQQTQRPVIRIVDRQTGQVLMQLPPEYVLQLGQQLSNSPDGQPARK